MGVSERRTCAALGQHRSTQRKAPRGRDDEERLTADTIELARQYGRYGYRKVAALLRDVNGGRIPGQCGGVKAGQRRQELLLWKGPRSGPFP
jgi:hypothetical protein